MSNPRLTVGFTTYNVARFLPEAIDAVLAQDFTDYEVVICDNGSTDATLEICDRYAARDPRFRVFRNPTNLGLSGSYNRLVSLAQGELLRWTSHDDLMAPTLLRRCVEALDEAGSAAVLAYPMTVYIDDRGAELGAWDDPIELRQSTAWRRVARFASGWNMCREQYGVIRMDALRRTGLLRPRLAMDVLLLTELAALGQFVQVPERLFFSRKHTDSTALVGRNPDGVLALLEPSAHTAPNGAGTKAKKVRPYHAGMVGDVARAMWRLDLPARTRASASAAYAGAWFVRRARVRLGALRQRWTGRTSAPRPWEPAAMEPATGPTPARELAERPAARAE